MAIMPPSAAAQKLKKFYQFADAVEKEAGVIPQRILYKIKCIYLEEMQYKKHRDLNKKILAKAIAAVIRLNIGELHGTMDEAEYLAKQYEKNPKLVKNETFYYAKYGHGTARRNRLKRMIRDVNVNKILKKEQTL